MKHLAFILFWGFGLLVPAALQGQTDVAPAGETYAQQGAPVESNQALATSQDPSAQAASAASQTPSSQKTNLTMGGASQFLSFDFVWALGAFILVLLLLLLVLKLIGRFSRFRVGRGRQSVFELKGVLPLDQRKYLAAVEIDNRLIVIGVAGDRISPVAHWAIDDLKEDDLENIFALSKDYPKINDNEPSFNLPTYDELETLAKAPPRPKK